MMRRYVIWLWILSGIPIGLTLIILPPAVRYWCFALFIILDTAHSISPVALAWAHKKFRQTVVLENKRRYIVLPLIIFGAAELFGCSSRQGQAALIVIYSAWNIYHFGMQNFGILSLLRGKRSQVARYSDMAMCLGLAVLFIVVVRGAYSDVAWILFLISGVVSVNHWIVDIGLTWRSMGKSWLMVIGLLIAGCSGFLFFYPTNSDMMIIGSAPVWLITSREAWGMIHFWYSRCVWQLSDPQVRATIGKELFA